MDSLWITLLKEYPHWIGLLAAAGLYIRHHIKHSKNLANAYDRLMTKCPKNWIYRPIYSQYRHDDIPVEVLTKEGGQS